MKYNITNNDKINKILLYFIIMSLIYLSRDSLFATSILGFHIAQIALLFIFITICSVFAINNKNKLLEILKSSKIKFLIISTIFVIVIMLLKMDFSLMYLSTLICLYYSVFIYYTYSFDELMKALVKIILLISAYSLITTYLGKTIFPIDYIPTFKNPTNLEFLNYLFSYSVNLPGYLRNFGCFREPGVFLFFLVLSFYLNYKYNKNVKQLFAYSIILVITMFSTFSSVGLVAIVVFALGIFFDKKLHQNKVIKWSIALVLLLLIVFIVLVINNPTLLPNDLYWELHSQIMKFTNINASLAPRLQSIIINLELFINNIFVGNAVETVMYALDHNTSTTMIMFSMFGIFGGLFSVYIWLLFFLDKNVKNLTKIHNFLFILSIFMTFNTQNLITNFFFWGIPLIYLFEENKIENDCLTFKTTINKYLNKKSKCANDVSYNHKMNRILIFHHYSYYGGAGKSLVDIINNIDKTKNEVYVYTRSESQDVPNILRKLSVNVIEGGNNPAIFDFYSGNERSLINIKNIRTILQLLRSSKEVKKIVNEIKPNSIIVNSFTLCWIGHCLKDYKHIKKVCFYRETLGKELLNVRNKYIKHCLKNYFDKIAYISEYDLNCIQNKNSVVITDKVEIIESNYNKTDVRKEFDLDLDKKYILFVGGISELKGTHIALQALNELPENYHLIIMQSKGFELMSNLKMKLRRVVGKDYVYKWNNFCLENNLLDRIHFYGTVFDIKKYYAISDFVLFSSTRPHQARPLYESGIYERPFIISDFECTKEFAINGYNCLTFEPGNFKQLAKLILDLEKNDELKRKLVINNKELTIKYHNVNNLDKELKEFLENI